MYHSKLFPDKKIILYKRTNHTYNSMQVHESIYVNNAQIFNLKGHLLHISCRQLYTFQMKQLQYANTWAREQYCKKKSNILLIIVHTFFAFFKTLILKTAFLDGTRGFLLSIIKAQYTFNKYTILWSLQNEKQNKQKKSNLSRNI